MTNYLLTALSISSLLCSAQKGISDHGGVKYGSEVRQFLDLYIAPSDTPTPVYFDAHGNGGDTCMPNEIISDLKAAGISTIAWESFTSVKQPVSLKLPGKV